MNLFERQLLLNNSKNAHKNVQIIEIKAINQDGNQFVSYASSFVSQASLDKQNEEPSNLGTGTVEIHEPSWSVRTEA